MWQGLTHDLSKFSPVEFNESAKYFQGTRSPIDASKEAYGYSLAWQHHMGHNPHHWEYWIDYASDGSIIPLKIPYKYVIEMICDWIGAGKVYGGDGWTQEEPLKYYNKVRAGRYFHADTEKLLVSMLETISNSGLETFHKKARSQLWRDWYGGGCKNGNHTECRLKCENPLTVEFVTKE